MHEKSAHMISAYCANIDFVKRVLSANEIEFEEQAGQLIITSPMDAGTESNIWGLFCTLNMPLPEFEYGVKKVITYYAMDIESIMKKHKCGIARHIYPKNVGNGMVCRFSREEDCYWVILEHDYAKKTVTAVKVKDLYNDDGIFCDDIYFHGKSGEKKLEHFCELKMEKHLVFCGYVNLKYYEKVLDEIEFSKFKTSNPMHDFTKFKQQESRCTSLY